MLTKLSGTTHNVLYYYSIYLKIKLKLQVLYMLKTLFSLLLMFFQNNSNLVIKKGV